MYTTLHHTMRTMHVTQGCSGVLTPGLLSRRPAGPFPRQSHSLPPHNSIALTQSSLCMRPHAAAPGPTPTMQSARDETSRTRPRTTCEVGGSVPGRDDWLTPDQQDTMVAAVLHNLGPMQAPLDGYNAMLRHIPAMAAEMGVQYATNDSGTELFAVSMHNMRVHGPTHKEVGAGERSVTPEECRDRGLSYTCTVVTDVVVDTYSVQLKQGRSGHAAPSSTPGADIGAITPQQVHAMNADPSKVPGWLRQAAASHSQATQGAAAKGAAVAAALGLTTAQLPGVGRRRITQAHLAQPAEDDACHWVHSGRSVHRGVVHAKLPLMVGSDPCRAAHGEGGLPCTRASPNALVELPGYFVVRGKDKAVVSTLKHAFNTPMVYAGTTPGKWVAELRSTHPARNRSSSTLCVRLDYTRAKEGVLLGTVKANFMVKPAPLMALFTAMGVPTPEVAAACIVTRGAAVDGAVLRCIAKEVNGGAAVQGVGDGLDVVAEAKAAHPRLMQHVTELLRASPGTPGGQGTSWAAMTPTDAAVALWKPPAGTAQQGTPEDERARAVRMAAYELFPQVAMGWDAAARVRKLQLLCVVVAHAVDVARGVEPADDRDNLGQRQVETAGHMLGVLYRQFLAEGLREGLRKVTEDAAKGNIPSPVALTSPRSLAEGLLGCVATGNMSIKGMGAASAQQGLSQALQLQSAQSAQSHLRRVVSSVSRESKAKAPRLLHPSAFALQCPYETPEGEVCGLQRQLALGALVLTGEGSAMLPRAVHSVLGRALVPTLTAADAAGNALRPKHDRPADTAADAVSAASSKFSLEGVMGTVKDVQEAGAAAAACARGVFPNGTVHAPPCAVLVGGHLSGYVTDAEEAAAVLRKARAKGGLPTVTEVVTRWRGRLLEVSVDAGRLRLPVLPLSPVGTPGGRLGPLRGFLATCAGTGAPPHEVWQEAVLQGYAGWLGPREAAQCKVASSPEASVRARDAAGADREYTHVLPSAMLMLGPLAACSPLNNCMPAVRATYSLGQFKGSIGTARPDPGVAASTAQLMYPQRSLVTTRGEVHAGVAAAPSGQNTLLAVCLRTDNQEDAVLMSQATAERGMGTSLLYKCYTEHATLGGKGSMRDAQDFTAPPPGVAGSRAANYGVLTPCGAPAVGSRVQQHDALIGRTMKAPAPGQGASGDTVERDQSLVLPLHTPAARVQHVRVAACDDGTTALSVRTVQHKLAAPGDKFSTRHGQKGVVSRLTPAADTPYCELGEVPYIVSTHGLPGRMTVGQLVEMTLGRLAAQQAVPLDATPNVSQVHADSLVDAAAQAGLCSVVGGNGSIVPPPRGGERVQACTAAELHAAAVAGGKAPPLAPLVHSFQHLLPRAVVEDVSGEETRAWAHCVGSASGVTLDSGAVYPAAAPEDLTVQHWVESLPPVSAAAAARSALVKALRDHGVPRAAEADATALSAPPQDVEQAVRRSFEARGVTKACVSTLYDPRTGEPCAWPTFVGVAKVWTLKQQAAGKLHSRARGPVQRRTRQPAKGRTKGGGFKCGEMERDALEAAGCAMNVRDAMAVRSDQCLLHVCRECGSLAVPPPPPGVKGVGVAAVEGQAHCERCGHGHAVHRVVSTHGTRNLVGYLAAAHVAVDMDVQDTSGVDLLGAPGAGVGVPKKFLPRAPPARSMVRHVAEVPPLVQPVGGVPSVTAPAVHEAPTQAPLARSLLDALTGTNGPTGVL